MIYVQTNGTTRDENGLANSLHALSIPGQSKPPLDIHPGKPL